MAANRVSTVSQDTQHALEEALLPGNVSLKRGRSLLRRGQTVGDSGWGNGSRTPRGLRRTLSLDSQDDNSSVVWSASAALARIQSPASLEEWLEDVQHDKIAISEEPVAAELPGLGVQRLTARDRLEVGLASIPGIVIGMAVNFMVCVPFGLAFFPSSWEPFPVPRALGIQMFLLSTLVCQVVMTASSDFPCALGMMMVENIPFMHSLAEQITSVQGYGTDALATTLVAFAISTLLIGVAFMALGRYKLGKATNYFPRHFIIGCIGGIGIFVTQTGFEVSTGQPWSWRWDTTQLYASAPLVPLWLVSVFLVILLALIARFIRWPFLAPLYFVGIIPAFYAALVVIGVDPSTARDAGWLFPRPPPTDISTLWTLYDFGAVRWDLVFATTPTMVALTCFGLMHAPINIPSLSMSTNREVDMNKELVVHGWSNILAGMFGGLPNYLCYSNSLLYYKCKGGGKGSGAAMSILLACAFVAGPGIISYVPRCMAGCLLIQVGLDLSREALVDSLEVFDALEYVCVLLIALSMTFLGMTTGLALGLVSSAVSFTLQRMQYSEPVRGMMPATTLRSSVRRSHAERDVLAERLRNVQVVQLHGTLFFGNATTLSDRIERMLSVAEGKIRTLILDFTLVDSLESSAAESIAKIYPMTQRFKCDLVFNRGSTEGFPTSTPLSKRLAGMASGENSGPELYISDDLDQALTWVEDRILAQAREQGTLVSEQSGDIRGRPGEPLPLRQLRELCPQEDVAVLERLLGYMERVDVPMGTMLWKQGSASDQCMLLSEGLLTFRLEEEAGTAEECSPGCIVGEYTLLTKERRSGTLTATRDSVVYRLGEDAWKTILKSDPYLAYVVSLICVEYLGLRCHNVANRVWDTKCVPI